MKTLTHKLKLLTLNTTINQLRINLLATHLLKHYKNISKPVLTHKDFNNYIIYEEDLLEGLTVGQVSILYEYCLAEYNPSDRKNKGQYFTPDDVAKWMVSHAETFPDGVWLDPCAGVGNLSHWLVSIQPNPEQFITSNLILNDIDPTALIIAKTLLYKNFYHNNENLYNIMSERFTQKNFLIDTLPEYDYVLMNPPYAATDKNDNFVTADSKELYAYFLEQTIITSKGFISVTPQSYTHSSKFKILRKLLLKHFNNIHIYNFDNIPDSIFKGVKYGSLNTNTVNSVRASILVAKNMLKKEYNITPLLRWRRNERNKMFTIVETQCSPQVFTENIFPKNYKTLTTLYNTTRKHKTLSHIISPNPTEHILYVPSTPRYYISATKRKLSRKSFHTLYFNNEKDLNYVYLLLNSSIMFWWWRVNDGGMTLSKTTLLTVPLISFPIKKSLINELEQSENINITVKLNSGLLNENVKHSQVLIKKLNKHIDSVNADSLFKLHNNTDFT